MVASYSSRQFNSILFISLMLHVFFLSELPHFKIIPPQKALTNLEVTYQRMKVAEMVNKKLLEAVEKRMLQPTAKENQQAASQKQKSNPPAFSRESAISKPNKVLVSKIKAAPIEERPLKDIVRLPEVSSPIMKNPAYVNYYQTIREKIKSVAYLDKPLAGDGEVFLTFILNSKGQLKAINVLQDKSVNNPTLQTLASGFIQTAAPFPVFPPELHHGELSFNVIIEFKITQ